MYSVEWNKDFENIDLYADISQVTAQDILEKFVIQMLSGHRLTVQRSVLLQ